jgi:hypothetical protein
VQVYVPDEIRTQVAMVISDKARRQDSNGLDGRPWYRVAAQLLAADTADRRRYLNRIYKARSRARCKEQRAA